VPGGLHRLVRGHLGTHGLGHAAGGVALENPGNRYGGRDLFALDRQLRRGPDVPPALGLGRSGHHVPRLRRDRGARLRLRPDPRDRDQGPQPRTDRVRPARESLVRERL
ncbi:MAG: hypothetical protein AVDCRST_MAG78-1809, partial [uncultured Rubrobacteraceae bacterium]